MTQDLRQSSEAVGLSQVSKMLRQLTGQISAHYSSSKINTHLRLFRPDEGPHAVHGLNSKTTISMLSLNGKIQSVEINNEDECITPMTQKFAIEKISQKLLRILAPGTINPKQP